MIKLVIKLEEKKHSNIIKIVEYITFTTKKVVFTLFIYLI